MDEKAPTDTVKIHTYMRFLDGFVAKNEFRQKPIEAPLVKKYEKMRLNPIVTKPIHSAVRNSQREPTKISNGEIGTPNVGRNNKDSTSNHGC